MNLVIVINLLVIDLFFIYYIFRELKYMYEYEQEQRMKKVIKKFLNNEYRTCGKK